MGENEVSKTHTLKETHTTKVDVGDVFISNPDEVQELVATGVLSGLAAMAQRGFTSTKISLVFKSTSKD